jgi:hypothetical protein
MRKSGFIRRRKSLVLVKNPCGLEPLERRRLMSAVQFHVTDDTAATGEGKSTVISVLGNDSADVPVVPGDFSDVNPEPAASASPIVSIYTQPANGTAVVNSDGTVTYTPNAGFIGKD